jgi:hypothetical protein
MTPVPLVADPVTIPVVEPTGVPEYDELQVPPEGLALIVIEAPLQSSEEPETGAAGNTLAERVE